MGFLGIGGFGLNDKTRKVLYVVGIVVGLGLMAIGVGLMVRAC